jgi:hypothetical protein
MEALDGAPSDQTAKQPMAPPIEAMDDAMRPDAISCVDSEILESSLVMIGTLGILG